MVHADATVVVGKPVHEVFQFLAEGRNNALWRPTVMDVALRSGRPGTVGSVYKQGLKDKKGKRVDGDYEITVVKQNEEINFQVVNGPDKAKGKFFLASVADGTRVRFSLDYEARGFGKLIEDNLSKQLQVEVMHLSNLKKYLEGQ
ncbi:MAG TPA: SRPBCC family protein [Fimbriimonadaceae bacterium]|jgi:uncharacterized membrane protein